MVDAAVHEPENPNGTFQGDERTSPADVDEDAEAAKKSMAERALMGSSPSPQPASCPRPVPKLEPFEREL